MRQASDYVSLLLRGSCLVKKGPLCCINQLLSDNRCAHPSIRPHHPIALTPYESTMCATRATNRSIQLTLQFTSIYIYIYIYIDVCQVLGAVYIFYFIREKQGRWSCTTRTTNTNTTYWWLVISTKTMYCIRHDELLHAIVNESKIAKTA